jgi:hypothetical protein
MFAQAVVRLVVAVNDALRAADADAAVAKDGASGRGEAADDASG